MSTPTTRSLLHAAVGSQAYLCAVIDDDRLWAQVAGVSCTARERAQLLVALAVLYNALHDQQQLAGGPAEAARLWRLRTRAVFARRALFAIAMGEQSPDVPLPEPVPDRPVPVPPERRGGRGRRAPVTAAQVVEAAHGGRVRRDDVAAELDISSATLGNILGREGVPSPWARKKVSA